MPCLPLLFNYKAKVVLAWRLQGSLRVAAVWRMRRYQSISWESFLPLAGDVLGYIATSQWNCGRSLGDRMGKFVMKTSRAWVGHSCCKSVLMLVAVESVLSSSVMWKDVNWVRLSASASGQPMLSIARIWRCCYHRVASGDHSETFWWLWGPTRWMGVLENGRPGSGVVNQAVDTCAVAAIVAAWAR
jgi:hypothetical protein